MLCTNHGFLTVTALLLFMTAVPWSTVSWGWASSGFLSINTNHTLISFLWNHSWLCLLTAQAVPQVVSSAASYVHGVHNILPALPLVGGEGVLVCQLGHVGNTETWLGSLKVHHTWCLMKVQLTVSYYLQRFILRYIADCTGIRFFYLKKNIT